MLALARTATMPYFVPLIFHISLVVSGFVAHPRTAPRQFGAAGDPSGERPVAASAAVLLPPFPPGRSAEDLAGPFRAAGFSGVMYGGTEEGGPAYRYSRATDMMRLVDGGDGGGYPRWVALVADEDALLVANGWGFLDTDESEPGSSFDADAADAEGKYVPLWADHGIVGDDAPYVLSDAGYDLRPLPAPAIERAASFLPERSADCLLRGATDPPHDAITADGAPLSVPAAAAAGGIFVTAIGGLPLFAAAALDVAGSARSGWPSFVAPLCAAHVRLRPCPAGTGRTEAVCARTGCHLGHFFAADAAGSARYCINASVLACVPAHAPLPPGAVPVGRPRGTRDGALESVVAPRAAAASAVLGCGCFWHVEAALRRLPGVLDTRAGYVLGTEPDPTYERVSAPGSPTGHAEAVRVSYDTRVLPTRVLVECFLAMHDATTVRAIGKRETGRGPYRSVFLAPEGEEAEEARRAVAEAGRILGRELATEVVGTESDHDSGRTKFFLAEDRHQRHDERLGAGGGAADLEQVRTEEWVRIYGERKASVVGSASTYVMATDD